MTRMKEELKIKKKTTRGLVRRRSSCSRLGLMRALLLLLVAALSLLGETVTVGSYSASGKMDNKQIEFKASAEAILRTPIWKSDADFPPLSVRKAQGSLAGKCRS